jgi:hypothetical protein
MLSAHIDPYVGRPLRLVPPPAVHLPPDCPPATTAHLHRMQAPTKALHAISLPGGKMCAACIVCGARAAAAPAVCLLTFNAALWRHRWLPCRHCRALVTLATVCQLTHYIADRAL